MKYCIYILSISIIFLIGCTKNDDGLLPDTPRGSSSITIIEDEIEGMPIVLAGSGRKKIIVAFDRRLNGSLRSFRAIQEELPAIMTDSSGNVYDIFGEVIDGPEIGSKLKNLNSGTGFWFAFSSLFPGIDLNGSGALAIEFEADSSSQWEIPKNAMARGASFNAIPSLENPKTIEYIPRNENPENDFYLDDDDLLIWVNINGQQKAYPHKLLNWHEIINDELGGIPIAVTYCPLTGTAKVWKRSHDNTYGVSGLLYNSNLIAYDRKTESYWPQILAVSVLGTRKDERASLVRHVEVTWKQLLNMDQTPLVISNETGTNRNYQQYPYGDYETNARISYPVLYQDDRLHSKERVFCIITDEGSKVYRFDDF